LHFLDYWIGESLPIGAIQPILHENLNMAHTQFCLSLALLKSANALFRLIPPNLKSQFRMIDLLFPFFFALGNYPNEQNKQLFSVDIEFISFLQDFFSI
jgi:hypothetical protein